MTMKPVNMMLAAAFIGAQLSGAQAGEKVTIDHNGLAQCGVMGDRAASAGEKPTTFANQFWSRMGCGRWDEAMQVLEAAPKSDPRVALPKVNDMFKDDVADCYYKSFAYDFTYHARSQDSIDTNKTVVKHGFYLLPDEKFEQIERATLKACGLKHHKM